MKPLLYKMNTTASQLAAMLSDFIPESMALGAAFAIGGSSAFLLCGLMALQNLPEGFKWQTNNTPIGPMENLL